MRTLLQDLHYALRMLRKSPGFPRWPCSRSRSASERTQPSFVFLGTVVGLAAALAATRILRRFLYEVSPTDPMTFVTVCVFLALVALFACLIPTRRAASIDPMVALRHE